MQQQTLDSWVQVVWKRKQPFRLTTPPNDPSSYGLTLDHYTLLTSDPNTFNSHLCQMLPSESHFSSLDSASAKYTYILSIIWDVALKNLPPLHLIHLPFP